MPNTLFRRRSLLSPRPSPAPSPSPGGDPLVSISQSNNATHLWRAETYEASGWVDDISSLALANEGSADALLTAVSGVDTVETVASSPSYLQVSIALAEPFEVLYLGRMTTAGGSRMVSFAATGADLDLYKSNGGSWAVTRINTFNTNIANDQEFKVFYLRYNEDSSIIKLGANAAATFGETNAVTANIISLGVRGSQLGTTTSNTNFTAIAFNADGNWSNANINAIATQMVSDASALSPAWSNIT